MTQSIIQFPSFLTDSADEAARKLLGCILVCTIGDEQVQVRIVETESYDEADAASHSYSGKSKRNAVMFGPAGHLYVYFTYGMHYCCNVVVGETGCGAAVLIRAVEPIVGASLLEARRGMSGVAATNGPAKLCQALGITGNLNGHDLRQPPVQLVVGNIYPDEVVATSPRIGISKAREEQRRYYIVGNPYVSRSH